MPVFLSSSRNARVTFPPEQFGMGTGVEYFFDANGNKVSKNLPHRPAKFLDGRLIEEKTNRVEMLRKHPGNMECGGNLFWEQKAADAAVMAGMLGRPLAHTPEGGLTEDDLVELRSLKTACKHLAPKAIDAVRARALKVHQRFRMAGIAPPPAEFNIMRVKARLVEILGVIEESGVWKDGDDGEDAVDSRSGKRAHG